jgi:hypothetical protein
MGHLQIWAVVIGALNSAWTPPDQVAACAEFERALDEVPHVALATRLGPIESIWPGEPVAACEVAFETNDSTRAGAAVPDFIPEPDNEMYRAGWRIIPEIGADGAGSGIYGIADRSVRCVVRWEQPAYIDDDGTFVQSETLTMLIQCSGGGTR